MAKQNLLEARTRLHMAQGLMVSTPENSPERMFAQEIAIAAEAAIAELEEEKGINIPYPLPGEYIYCPRGCDSPRVFCFMCGDCCKK